MGSAGRLRRLPQPQRPDLRVGREQVRQCGRAGAREAEDEDRSLDPFGLDGWVLAVATLDPQPIPQEDIEILVGKSRGGSKEGVHANSNWRYYCKLLDEE